MTTTEKIGRRDPLRVAVRCIDTHWRSVVEAVHRLKQILRDTALQLDGDEYLSPDELQFGRKTWRLRVACDQRIAVQRSRLAVVWRGAADGTHYHVAACIVDTEGGDVADAE